MVFFESLASDALRTCSELIWGKASVDGVTRSGASGCFPSPLPYAFQKQFNLMFKQEMELSMMASQAPFGKTGFIP